MYLQLRIVAYDSANPNQKATALVTIAVTRNENEPRFSDRRYTVDAVETAALGTSIQQVEATDADGVILVVFLCHLLNQTCSF